MKLTINAKELENWYACGDGVYDFVQVHGDKTVSLKDALESNSVEDFLFVFFRNKSRFSGAQVKDLKFLLCDYAEHVLHVYEDKYPKDHRPRKAIEAARNCINGFDDVTACYVAYAAKNDAASKSDYTSANAAYAAAKVYDYVVAKDYSANAYTALNVVNSASRAADSWKEEKEWQKQKLIDVIDKWERS